VYYILAFTIGFGIILLIPIWIKRRFFKDPTTTASDKKDNIE
jgi:hypothetical protein